MDIKFVDLKKNYSNISTEIQVEISNLFEKCDFIQGEKVKKFEDNFANYLGLKHFIGCGNGTDALEIAVKSLDLKYGDEIIVQGNTYIATCFGVTNNNIKLVLCDVEKDTHMIDFNKMKEKVTENTKVIIVVHLFGLVPNMDEILSFCKDKNIYLIEDCAQAHGAAWDNKKVGTFGDISCFSFYPGKNLGAYGDGGGIGVNDDILNKKIRKILNLGCKIKYHHEIIGRNSRLDTIQAAFLDVKLKYLDDWNELRRKNAENYIKNLSNNINITLPKYHELCTPVYHLFVIKTKFRDELQSYLKDRNIPTLIHYPISISETEAFKDFNFNDLDNSIKNSKEILSLPMYPELKEKEIKHICNQINNFYLENNLYKLTDIVTNNKPGILHCINSISFDTKRLFYLDNFKFSENNKRGFHANINFDELIVIISGSINIKLININMKETIVNLTKNNVYLIPRMNWLEYEILEENSIILVLVNEVLNSSKGIFNFSDFEKLSL